MNDERVEKHGAEVRHDGEEQQVRERGMGLRSTL